MQLFALSFTFSSSFQTVGSNSVTNNLKLLYGLSLLDVNRSILFDNMLLAQSDWGIDEMMDSMKYSGGKNRFTTHEHILHPSVWLKLQQN